MMSAIVASVAAPSFWGPRGASGPNSGECTCLCVHSPGLVLSNNVGGSGECGRAFICVDHGDPGAE